VAHARVTLTGKADALKMRRLRVRVPPRVRDPGSSNRQDDSPWSCLLGFESLSRNHADSHGLRPRLRTADDPDRHRMAAPRAHGGMADTLARGASSREGSPGSSPGGRTHAMPFRPASASLTGSTPVRSAHAFRASARVFLVGTRCPGQHRGKAPCGCSSAGQSIGLPSRRSPVRSRSAARMRWWWNFGRHASPRN
jgi:hypothetical protein